jgi:hypothetical protein
MQQRLERAIEVGELRAGVDVGALVSMIVGPIFYRRFISRQDVSPEFVGQLVRSALSPILSGTPVV